MSSFSSPFIPSRFKRKSSSASTSYSIDNYSYGLGEPTPSSPLLSSSPLLTPLHLALPYEWRTDDLRGSIYDHQDKMDDFYHPRSRHARSEHSYTHRVLPSLMTKFATSTLWGDTPLPYSPSAFSSAPQTAHFCLQGDSVIADDCEEHDLESMNIHIRETYFATSAERGRWLSSPIAPRLRSRVAQPTHGYSSPIKSPADISPLGEHLRERAKSCTIDQQIPTEEHDDDMHCSSPLPPSSPLSSPLSHLSFLGDDCEDNVTVDPFSNSDDSNFSGATPELSTACTSPTESARALVLPTAPDINSPLTPSHSHSHLADSTISCQLRPHHSHSPNPDASGFESDGVLSPLSQFELDLPEPEPLKLPLSDMENKLYPGQHVATPGVDVDTIRPPIQFPSMNSNDEPLDVSLQTVVRANSRKSAKKRRENSTGNPRARQTKRRTAIWPGSPSSDRKKKRGVENHTSNNLEPPRKKSKLSHCLDDCGGKSQRKRDEISKVERRRRSPSLPAVESCGSGSERPLHGDKTSKFAAEPVPRGASDAEFHGSLTGILIEALATSRATSMDSSALYIALTQAHPYLVAERSKQELLTDIIGVLEAGRDRCGMFEKVDCSGERTRRDMALESRWFYVAERDEDPERASLMSAIMPRQKRNETKKYKQYYYRPLDKISRWDPEDAP